MTSSRHGTPTVDRGFPSGDKNVPKLEGGLDHTVVHHLLLLVNLIAKPFFDRHGKRYSLSLNEWRIIMALANHPGISVSRICDHTGMHVMNVSRGVRRLVRMGRVDRSVDEIDRRRSVLRLSDEGYALFRELAPIANTREEIIRGGLTEAEAETLVRLLRKLIDHFRADPSGSPTGEPPERG